MEMLTKLEELILLHALGREVAMVERERRAAGVMMLPIPRAGVLRSVVGAGEARAVPGIEDLVMSVAVGTEVEPLPEAPPTSRSSARLWTRSSRSARTTSLRCSASSLARPG